MKPLASLFMDNFALQDVAGILVEGLDDDERVELAQPSSGSGYEIRSISSAGVQVETLLQVLNSIVLQDELFVDAGFIDTWFSKDSPLRPLRDEHLVIAKPLSEVRAEWLAIRHQVEEALCFAPELQRDFQTFRDNWKPGIQDPIFSTLIWGTAGVIARSQYMNRPYLAHPSRGRVVGLGSLVYQKINAHDVVDRFISTKRTELFTRVTAGQVSQTATLSLPQVALEVVAECKDASDLIPVALQLRSKYRKLREWIAAYQQALELGPKEAAKYAALLEAAGRDIENLFKGSWWAQLSFDLSLSLTSLPQLGGGIAAPVGAWIQQNLPGSVRTAVSKLIQQPWDTEALAKLCKLCAGDSPQVRADVLRHLRGS